ncbi:hypothetical protein [Streptomyces sp. NPDC047108]|uniref:hypothetical protein n=1 Tax=Streptomyces sp. NPDC047108 TaxID=3155025 RepID=UPI0033F05C88
MREARLAEVWTGFVHHGRVFADVGEQQVHRVAADRYGPLPIGDALSGQVSLRVVAFLPR